MSPLVPGLCSSPPSFHDLLFLPARYKRGSFVSSFNLSTGSTDGCANFLCFLTSTHTQAKQMAAAEKRKAAREKSFVPPDEDQPKKEKKLKGISMFIYLHFYFF